MLNLTESQIGDIENIEHVTNIVRIVNSIRIDQDYAKAASILQDSGLTLFQLTTMTLRLSLHDIAKLGDELAKI